MPDTTTEILMAFSEKQSAYNRSKEPKSMPVLQMDLYLH